MMHAFRAFAKSWLARGLFAILAVSFIIWGANTKLTPGAGCCAG